MHIGHLVPFMFTKWLQDVFDCPLVIQISDEEKAAFKKIPFITPYRMGFENAKEIISLGFNPKKTFIFSNRDYRLNVKEYESFTSEMKMHVTLNYIQKIFGLNEEATVAMYDWPFYQSAAGFYQAYPHIFQGRPAYCLVPHAIDQDPYFRLGRDLATKMNLIKTCTIMCTFIPPLTGMVGKMNSSIGTEATLFLTDTPEKLKEKVMKHSFSGGGGDGTLEQHRLYGGNPDVDIAYQYLRYFEEDDAKLQHLHDGFKKGEIACGELKAILAEKLAAIIKNIQETRKTIDQSVLDDFYSYKPIELPKPKQKPITQEEAKLYEQFANLGIEHRTKYHNPITTPEEQIELGSTLEGTVCKIEFLKGAGSTFYLYITDIRKVLNTKTFHKVLGIKKISYGEKDTFEKILKVNKRYGTLFALPNDTEKSLTIIIDEAIPKDKPVNFLGMRPDATVTIQFSDMVKFIEGHGYAIQYVKAE